MADKPHHGPKRSVRKKARRDRRRAHDDGPLLPDPVTRPPRRRVPGASKPAGVRSDGDPEWAKLLASAIALAGRVERATHGFHTYPAGLNADAAAMIVEACPGAVHDPFCGGGTVLVEGILHDRPVSGTDLSPVAILVAQARTAAPTLATPLRSASRRITAAARQPTSPVDIPEGLEDWYEPHVAQELGHIVQGIAQADEAVQPLLRAVLSSIVVKTSFRESDTSNRQRKTHRPPGTTAILFHKKARELGRMIETLPAERRVDLQLADARLHAPSGGVGLVLTSPPYPGVYDYLPMQQLRTAWLGLDVDRGLAQEIGSRRSFRAKGRSDAFRDWREDTTRWIGTQAQSLVPGGRMVIVVGDGLVAGRMVDALSSTVESMRAAGMRIVARASADRPDFAREVIRTEHLLMGERV